MALSPLTLMAQISSGYYRLKNAETQRYMSIVDTIADFKVGPSYKNYVYADMDAIYMLENFEDSVAFNPATICYVEHMGGTQHNLSGQGLDLHARTGRYLDAIARGEYYRIYATGSGGGITVTRYLIDNTVRGTYFHPQIGDDNTTNNNRNWSVLEVDQSDTQYFGIKPDVQATADNFYWSTLYAGFPFKASDSAMKTYIVKTVDEALGYAVIAEVDEVPAQLPVLIRCAGATPANNKTTLLSPSTTASYGTNYLQGNYYCNDVEDTNHRNVTAYNSSTMRMLGTTEDGKPAFVKSNISYLPANKCYLAVSTDAPDVLEIITEEEYQKAQKQETFNDGTKYANLQDNTIDGTYFNLPAGDGYDATEEAIVVNSTMTAEQMDAILNATDQTAAIKANYKGIIIDVPASYGTITVDVKTLGSHVLMVKVGDAEAKSVTQAERGKVAVSYNVNKPTKVYIYAAETTAAATPRRTAAENSVVLYGYQLSAGSTGIETITTVAPRPTAKEGWYTLDGRRLQSAPTTKGLYIVNGKKVIIK